MARPRIKDTYLVLLPWPMRCLALAVALAALAAGAGATAVAGGALAQSDDAPADHFTVACKQVRCVFDATNATLEDDTIASHGWAFGDGDTDSGEVVNHAYERGDTYEVTLTLQGENDTTVEETRSIRVFDAREEDGGIPWSALGVGAAVLAGSLVLARST